MDASVRKLAAHCVYCHPTIVPSYLPLPPYFPVAIGSPMMATLVEPGQMQFAASGGLSALSLPSSTSLASSLQGIPSAGNMAMHHAAIAASNGASMSLQDFGSLTHSSDSTQYAPAPKRQRIGSARESYSTLDPQSDISSVLREQPQLAEGPAPVNIELTLTLVCTLSLQS